LVISRVQGLLLPAISLVLLCGVSGYQKSNRFTTGVFVLGACLCILIFLIELLFGLLPWLFSSLGAPIDFLGFDLFTNIWLFLSLGGIYLIRAHKRGRRISTGTERTSLILKFKNWLYFFLVVCLFLLIAGLVLNLYLRKKIATTSPSTSRNFSEYSSLELGVDQALLLSLASNSVILEIPNIYNNSATFRLHVKNLENQTETTSTGIVEEVYIGSWPFRIVNATDHRSHIQAKDLSIYWSYCSPTSSWIYYDPKQVDEDKIKITNMGSGIRGDPDQASK